MQPGDLKEPHLQYVRNVHHASAAVQGEPGTADPEKPSQDRLTVVENCRQLGDAQDANDGQ